MPTDILYHSLSAQLITGLMQQLLFVGVFIISLAIIRRCVRDSDWSTSTDFCWYLILTFSVTVFTLYIALTYEVENFKGVKYQVSDQKTEMITFQLKNLDGAQLRSAKTLLLVMMPVDLIGIALNSAMFGLITIFLLDEKKWDARNISTIRLGLTLLILTISWHCTMIVWWILYGLLTGGWGQVWGEFGSIVFHLTYIVLEAITILIVHKLYRTRFGLSHSHALAGITAGTISLIYLSLYVFRLWTYTDRFIDILTTRSS